MYLYDTTGKSYLDFVGGWAVNALGHSPEQISTALERQSRTLVNAGPGFLNRPQIEFAERIVQASGMDRVWFGSTGAEVNEAAVKLARKFGKVNGRGHEIITTGNSFHGRTLAMMSATGKAAWPDLFGPAAPGFRHVPFNDLEAAVKAVEEKTIAIMIEPVQGEGGAIPANPEYVKGLRRLCDEKKLVLIFDEVQTGMGRTGSLFAFQDYGVRPDILTLGKGIGGGYPLSAVLADESLNLFDAGDHGGTYGGQPLAMAVGLAVLDVLEKPEFLTRVRDAGNYLKESLESLSKETGIFGVRGKGLLVGCDLPERDGKEVVNDCLSQGLIINSPRPENLRFIPPLIASRENVDEMIRILRQVLLSRR